VQTFLELPPRLINDLIDSVSLPDEVKTEVLRLVELKKQDNLKNGPPIPVLGL
jgi:hypothetical protein